MSEFLTPSNAKVCITISDYSTSFDLMKAVLRAVRQGGLSSKMPGGDDMADLADFTKKDLKEIGGLLDAVVDVITSKEVEDLIFKCMERCTYDDEKITRATFEKEERRGDFLYVAFEVLKANVNPFMSHLTSGLKGIFQQKKSDSPALK